MHILLNGLQWLALGGDYPLLRGSLHFFHAMEFCVFDAGVSRFESAVASGALCALLEAEGFWLFCLFPFW